ncbi:N(6)-adenine-specific methyltransferase METTL4-like isoform X2 [Xenia sp. Carnegie-2017]|uniref:N(6)-adenine-specific methyltransferase METTL4-like isoform X2 n=1 Tax=Xenia sp. Carnegie-2017 TaxID=2897299 RepID=UPI001F047FDC|nr:N(6)-adenine-specific methyltransferase METTL4-like isoform X2 [Xenia sp. Carnegie-2017]
MTVVFKCASGLLVDHKRSLTISCGELSYKCVENLFDIRTPYQEKFHQNIKCLDSLNSDKNITLSKKRRKRKLPENSGELAALAHHSMVRDRIISAVKNLSEFNEWSLFFSLNLSKNNDSELNQCLDIEIQNKWLQASQHNNDLLELVSGKVIHVEKTILYPANNVSYESTAIVNRMVENKEDDGLVISVDETSYLIPPGSKFMLSDFTYFCKSFLNSGTKKFNMIVIDPPWENKSVKRGAKYCSLPHWEIKKIPVPELACDQALVAVWVTNKQKYRKFIIEDVFANWSCNLIGEWHWIKLTNQGKMVMNIDSLHKKPYEPLILGKFQAPHSCHVAHNSSDDVCTDSVSLPFENVTKQKREIPESHVICSIPCSLHSRKPPLNDIFDEYLPQDAACIELFARNLIPNWTSWGNEVLKYQHVDFFRSQKR